MPEYLEVISQRLYKDAIQYFGRTNALGVGDKLIILRSIGEFVDTRHTITESSIIELPVLRLYNQIISYGFKSPLRDGASKKNQETKDDYKGNYLEK